MSKDEYILSILKIILGLTILIVSCLVTAINIPISKLVYVNIVMDHNFKAFLIILLMLLMTPAEFVGFAGGIYLISENIKKVF